ncbi:MAG: polymer-forming cytoskeletal protein [Gemmatimonadaceae bacterium]|nr:polymer-forming cytoskeletal protein [Gemmatimonadaceae bacterium]
MAIWKDPTPPKKAPTTATTDVTSTEAPRAEFTPRAEAPTRVVAHPVVDPPRHVAARETRESLIAAEIAIEGKIEGTGHVRIAGRFTGDVQVQGNLAIEDGAKLTGGVKAGTVTVGGELEGNIDSAARVELLSTGVLTGDVKAGSLTVAAGSRMRGKVEFGWDDKAALARSVGRADSSAA